MLIKFTVHCSLFTVILLSTSYLLPSTIYSQEATPTATPSATRLNSEEGAVYNLNQGLLPKEVIVDHPQNQDQNFLNQILQGFLNFFTRIIDPTKFFAQSETIHQASIPLSPQESTPGGQIKEFLGGSTGIYGVTLPKEVQSNDIQNSEQSYEKANFPEGI